MADLPHALHELIKDPQGNQAQTQLLDVVHRLEQQGIHPQAVCRALLRVLMTLCHVQYHQWGPNRIWALKFFHDAGATLKQEVDNLNWYEQRALAERKILDGKPAGSA